VTDTAITPVGTFAYPSSHIHNFPQKYRNLYRIRNDVPYFQGTVVAGTQNTITASANASATNDIYTNKWIVITNDTRDISTGVISAITPGTGSPTWYEEFSPAFPTLVSIPSTAGINANDLDNYKLYVSTLWAGTPYLVILDIASIVNGTDLYVYTGIPVEFFVGDTFWVVYNNPLVNQRQKISAYNGATQVITTGQKFSGPVVAGDTFDILTVNYDNFSSLSIFTDNVITRDEVCYEITLHSLSLPNIPIKNGNGNRIAFYPYIYLEFSSGSSSSYNNIFITNVPNLSKRLFKIPIYNVVTPFSSDFVVLNGLGMKQRVKWKVSDNYNVRVYLPNGEVIVYDIADSQPPNAPLPNVQISVTIGLRNL
jgi:hypothetical protein